MPGAEPLRFAIVVPRFGEWVSGGAELFGRWLAERLAGAGHSVEVFTTCAKDHRSWANELPAGVERHGDITVRRFEARTRDPGIFGELDLAIHKGYPLSADEEVLWLRHGVSSDEMEIEIGQRGGSYDVLLCLPYLFGTTYFAYQASPNNAVVIPCLHDEPYSHLDFVRGMFEGCRGLLFNSPAEEALARRITPGLAPSGVVGVGVEMPRSRVPKASPPSMLYVGRREAGKNSPLLTDYFIRYKGRRPGALRLVFGGSGDPIPDRSDVVEVTPRWSDDSTYRAATLYCQPSVNESFSIVLLQAWLAEVPAIVHGNCAVTRDHCERSNAGLWFSSYAEFEEVVDLLMSSEGLRRTLGRNGRAYVEREYSWAAVMERFSAVMEQLLGRPVVPAAT